MVSSSYKDAAPLLGMVMVMVECTTVGVNVLFKTTSSKGLSFYVFVSYSFLVATLLLFPCIFFFNRNLEIPPNRFSLFCRILLMGSIGCLSNTFTYEGIMYSSPTLAAAMSNLIPAFTFLLAILFRMERLAWKCQSTQAKVIGTVVSIIGACVVTLYKGPTLALTATPSTTSWVIGGLLLAAAYLMISICYIIQAKVMKDYPAEVNVVFLYVLCATVVSSIIGLMVERNPSAWKLSFDVKFSAILYSGFFGCLFSPIVHTWGVRVKGPVYVAMFRPLSIAIAAIMSSLFLGESLHLGSVMGAIVISVGFYAVMWGKAKEEKREDMDDTTPLLHSKASM